jgi:very-short-patch-repair endonuclease
VSGADPFSGRVAAALVRRPAAVVCGVTAARLLGLRALPALTPDEPVHLLIHGSPVRNAARGIALHFGAVPAKDRWWRDGMPVTSVLRTLADLLLLWDRPDAVALLDTAAHDRRFRDVAEVGARLLGRHGGVARVRWLADVDARSESALESRIRLVLSDRGLSPTELQYRVLDGTGRFVARVDLAYPGRRLVVEADGAAFHSDHGGDPTPLYRDRDRQNQLSRLGWTVLRFTWPDVLTRPDHIAALVRHALSGG